jgi:molecular chaperone DnaJ
MKVLKDDKKRKAYDQYGSASQQPGFDPDAFARASQGFGAGGFGGGFPFGASFGGGGGGGGGGAANMFEELFSSAFRTSSRGNDIQASAGLSFMDACKGVKRSVTVEPIVDCDPCKGSGLKAGARRSECRACGGSGTRTFIMDNGFHMASTCTTCSGAGSTVARGDRCGSCAGVGKVKTKRSVQVEIPAGVCSDPILPLICPDPHSWGS